MEACQAAAMEVQGYGMTQSNSTPPAGHFKRNPPIAGEAEALERAKNGDPDAFSKLYALHKRRVYTYVSACWATCLKQKT